MCFVADLLFRSLGFVTVLRVAGSSEKTRRPMEGGRELKLAETRGSASNVGEPVFSLTALRR